MRSYPLRQPAPTVWEVVLGHDTALAAISPTEARGEVIDLLIVCRLPAGHHPIDGVYPCLGRGKSCRYPTCC